MPDHPGGRGSTPHLDAPTVVPWHQVDNGSAIAALPFERRYTARGQLGVGGMGEVKLLDDHQVGRTVACKVLLPEIAEEDDGRFVREARTQGQLEHPSVVPVYDLGVGPDGRPYFTMRRVMGATLEEILVGLQNGDPEITEKYPRRRLLSAFLQVCLAIDFSHERGVLHRDLKPANIMLGDFGEVYVLDWGLSKHWDEGDGTSPKAAAVALPGLTMPGSSMGTPGYAPPEQVGGRLDELGPWTDVYALGAILFEVLTLQPLHPIGPIERMLASTLQGIEARPSARFPALRVAPELDSLCASTTAVQPSCRLRTAREVHDAIDRYLGGERDVELRVALSQTHAQKAASNAEACRQHEGANLEHRREAMREIGRALALDPNNDLAMQTLVRLMNTPPVQTPSEVEGELERSEEHRIGKAARYAGFAYLGVFAFLPLLLWAGVQSALPVAVFYGLILLSAAMSLWAGFVGRPTTKKVFVVMVMSNLAYAVFSSFYGPLLLAPGMVAINATAFAMLFDRPVRLLSTGIGCLALLIPVVLELLGVLAPSYAFDGRGMTILPTTLQLPAVPTWLVMTFGSAATVVIGAVSAGFVKDTLRQAERHLFLYAWHIGELTHTNRAPNDATVADRAA